MEQLFCGRARSIVQQLYFAQIRVGLVVMETTVEIKMFVGKEGIKNKKKRFGLHPLILVQKVM